MSHARPSSVIPITSSTINAPATPSASRRAGLTEAELDQTLDAQRAPARGYVLSHPGRSFTAAQVARAIGLPEERVMHHLTEAMDEGEVDAEVRSGTWRYSAPARAAAPRRRDLVRLLAVLDPCALRLARYSYDESQRTGRLSPCYAFESWLLDAIYERAAGVAHCLLGFPGTPIGDARPGHVEDIDGLGRGLYYAEGV